MKSTKFIFYSLLIIILNKNYILSADQRVIIFPLKKSDSSKVKDTKNINNVMKFIFSSPLITELEIGTPSQKINFMIRPLEKLIYFTSCNHTIEMYDDETTKIDIIKYGKINNFNENKSTSISYEKEQPNIPSYFYYNFNKGTKFKDYLKFN